MCHLKGQEVNCETPVNTLCCASTWYGSVLPWRFENCCSMKGSVKIVAMLFCCEKKDFFRFFFFFLIQALSK